MIPFPYLLLPHQDLPSDNRLGKLLDIMSHDGPYSNEMDGFNNFTGAMFGLALGMALLVAILLIFQNPILHTGDVVWNALDRWFTWL